MELREAEAEAELIVVCLEDYEGIWREACLLYMQNRYWDQYDEPAGPGLSEPGCRLIFLPFRGFS